VTASSPARIPGDQARVTVLVEVEPALAFHVFTEEIDQWWRRGAKFRLSGKSHGILRLEPGVGGRLFESFSSPSGIARVIETGRVTAWEPPSRLVFEWRAANFAKDEKTEVEIVFEATASGNTSVTVTHRGWSAIRPDHPARHSQEVAPFLRSMGMWWGDQMTSLREHARSHSR
jgi:uncharacterized protein YndB with AHSA1/START domain